MVEVLITVLAIALIFAVIKQRSHVLAAQRLTRALRGKQPLLSEDLPGTAGKAWDELCAASNELIGEAQHLQRLRNSQLAQLEATLGSLQEAVLIVDGNNYVLLANRALQEIFPAAVNILNQRLERVLHSVEFLNYVELVRRNEGVAQREIEFIENNRATWLEVTGTVIPPLDGQKVPWTLFVLHNITKQKLLERVRKEFVANVSHELRTPLSVIKGYVETLVDAGADIPDADRERFLKTIQRHTDRLNSLLEDLLILSRLESLNPGLAREPVDVAVLLSTIVDDYRSRPTSHNHRLTLDVEPRPPALSADVSKLTQVLENLLDNALKYTPAGSLIQVSAKARNAELVISVIDNGAGIPPADVPHIFERFYRVEKGRSRDQGGTGLGLSIVKHIAQLHGGKAWVDSVQGQGSAFHISIPFTFGSAESTA